MEKIILSSSAMVIALLSSTTTAGDFHALSAVQTVPTSIQNQELSMIRGGATCNFTTVSSAGGVALCGDIGGAQGANGSTSSTASFTVANEFPVTGAQFLQVIN